VPSSTSAGAAIGVGIGPGDIKRVVGVFKAYMTRVGNGPMPTEQLNEDGNMLRLNGPRPEVGVTTGRPRRTGWFDAVVSSYSASLNSVTSVALTRLDVLDVFASIQVCTAYKIDGRLVDVPPASIADFNRAEPVWEELPGWQDDSTKARKFSELPENAQRYVRRLEELIGKPIDIVSVGPERDQVIMVNGALGWG
jgi:adenylosuccinate synthase